MSLAVGIFVSTFCWAKETPQIETSVIEVAGISYSLHQEGYLIVKSPKYSNEIEVEVPDGYITQILDVQNRIVLISSNRTAYLLNMPLPQNSVSKRLTSWASQSRLADLFGFRWMKKFRPQVVKLELLKMGGTTVHIYHAVPVVRAGENDVMLKSLWENYSLRQLLLGIDSKGEPTEQMCANLLNPF